MRAAVVLLACSCALSTSLRAQEAPRSRFYSGLGPYVLGARAVYRLSGMQQFCAASGRLFVDPVTGAMIGGLGFRWRLRGLELFTEARVSGFTNGRGWGSALIPVTAGLQL